MSLEELLHAEEPQEAAIRAARSVGRHGVSPRSVGATRGEDRPPERRAAPQEQLVWK